MQAKKRAARRSYEMDMTAGPMLPQVLRFTAPLILTGVLQLLYNAADVVVVGQFAGAQALAAVGSTGSLINLLVNLFMGLSVGASVVVARAYGARDFAAVRRGVQTSMTVSVILGVFVMILGLVLAKPLLYAMGTPDDVIDQADLYLSIYFAGMPFNMIYTFGAAILRAVGDTKRPLYYLTLSGAVNVVLNLVLVIVFHMGVAGVAIATVVSQVISMALVTVCMLRSEGAIHLDLHKLGVNGATLKEIVRVGLPAGVQGSLFSISNVLIQSAVNSFGSTVMAGNAAASNLEGFIYISMNSVYQAALTFTSANMGAKKYRRVRRNMWVCLGTVTAVGILLGVIFRIFATPLLSIYNTDPEVIRYGEIRMGIICVTYFFCGLMDTMVGQLRGIGYSIMPMIVSLTGACLLRIVWIYTIFAATPTLETLYISYPISWAVTFAVHLACYGVVSRKLPRVDEAGA